MERKEVERNVKELLERWHMITYVTEKELSKLRTWLAASLIIQFFIPSALLEYLLFTHQIDNIKYLLYLLVCLSMTSVTMTGVTFMEVMTTSTITLRAIMPKVIEMCTDEEEGEPEEAEGEESSNAESS